MSLGFVDQMPVSGAEAVARPTLLPAADRAVAVTDEAFTQLGGQGTERWTSPSPTGIGRQPERFGRAWQPSQFDPRWESLEDAMSLMAEPATAPLPDSETPLQDALFARIDGQRR